MEKVGGLAAGLAVVLAIVGGFVSIPGLEVGLIILVLGIIGGIAADQDGAIRMYLAVLVLPAVGAVLGAIPAIGEYLNLQQPCCCGRWYVRIANHTSLVRYGDGCAERPFVRL